MSPAYVLKRIALIGYTLLVVSLIVFAITQILPADAAVMLLGENATAEALAAVREKNGPQCLGLGSIRSLAGKRIAGRLWHLHAQ